MQEPEALYDVPYIAARYRCSEKTARRIMHQMEHITRPRLLVTASAICQYDYDLAHPQQRSVKRRSAIIRPPTDGPIPRRKPCLS